MTPGVYMGLDERLYHADADSISASGMKLILKSPADFRLGVTPTRAMRLGTATHTAVLGAGAATRYVDAASWRGKEAMAAEAEADAAGETALLEGDRPLVDGMTASIRAHPTAAKLLAAEGDAEVSMFWRDTAWAVTRRCRWDYLTTAGVGIDLKTTSSALTDSALAKTITDWGYDLSASWYVACAQGLGIDITEFHLIFVQSTPPHGVRVVNLASTFFDRGEQLAEKALAIWSQCTNDGDWPAWHTTDSTTIYPPSWARGEVA